jgi:general secretion pathway protein F
VFFLVQVIPNFSSLFSDSGNDPGALVRFVLALSDGLVANETALEAGGAALLLAGLLASRHPGLRGAIVTWVLALPGPRTVWRLWRTSRFLSSLALLLGQGVPLTEALKVLDGAVGTDGRVALASVGDAVRRGARLCEALGTVDLLPPVAVRMVRIGEQTGELPKVAGEAGALYAAQLEKKLDTLSAVIGPAAILLIAGLIGGLMVTIMSALVSVDQAVM